MSTPSLPTPYGRHVFVCTHGNCAPAAQAEQLFRRLELLVREHGRHRLSDPRRILCSRSGCLGVCLGGPLLVVYPEGIWYGQVDETRLARIVQEHLVAGRPVEAWILHRHYPPGQEPAYAPDLRPPPAEDPLLRLAEAAADQAQAPADESELPEHVRAARERRRNHRKTPRGSPPSSGT